MGDLKKARPVLLGGAAIYMVYTAYSLFKERSDPESSMPVWMICLFSAVFVLAAVAIALYAYKLWKIQKKSDEEYEKSLAEKEATEKAEEDHAQSMNTPDPAEDGESIGQQVPGSREE